MPKPPRTQWVRPGSDGFPNETITVYDSGRGKNQLKRAANMGKGARRRLAGGAGVFRPNMPGLSLTVTMQGANVVAEHAEAFEQMIGPLIYSIQDITGMWARDAARSIVPVDSGDTRDSIYYVLGTSGLGTYGQVDVTIGPTTFYAPFIEYGLGGHMAIGPRPFMMDTFFHILPVWRSVFLELADIGKRGQGSNSFRKDPYASTLNAQIRALRQRLYSIEKEIGDIFPLGLPIGIGRHARGAMINSARFLGDIQSVVGRAVGARYTRRLTGKVTGRLIGIGAHTVFGNSTYTTGVPGASGGMRIYNRVAGKYMARFVGQNRLMSGG